MPKVNFCVIVCSNSTYEIKKWKKETFTEHNLEGEGIYEKKGDCLELNVNHRFIYIFFFAPLNVNN